MCHVRSARAKTDKTFFSELLSKTTAAARIAKSVPEPSAMLRSAWASAGASLMPLMRACFTTWYACRCFGLGQAAIADEDAVPGDQASDAAALVNLNLIRFVGGTSVLFSITPQRLAQRMFRVAFE